MGIRGMGLLDQLRLYGLTDYSVDDCEQFIDEWLTAHPGVRDYQQAMHARARRYGHVSDMYGRRFLLPGARSSNGKVSGDACRQAQALPIQSSAQGIMKNIMRRVEFEVIPRLEEAGVEGFEPVLQIHDEIVAVVRAEDVPAVNREMLEVMTTSQPPGFAVPVESSAAVEETWGRLK